MSSTSIQGAKIELPLCSLLEQLGIRANGKKNARCPFHHDRSRSTREQAIIPKSEYGNGVANCKSPVVSATSSVTPPPLGDLLEAVEVILRRYVVFPLKEQAPVIAVWIAHTWAIKAFDFTPYLNVFSASKRSGKSRVLEVINLLARNPQLTSGGSSAGLLRSIEENNPPTILLDEVDAVYGKKKDSEAESQRQFLNAGFRRGNTFLRCVGQGANLEPKKFPAFCPKALAGIGRCLPDTVVDRSLPIELVRQSREEKAERFREREAKEIVASIRDELEAWTKQPEVLEELRDARPTLPEELNDRAQDITEPLIAIADLAGGQWPHRIRGALVKLCSQEEDADVGVQLLAAIKAIFDETGDYKLTTRQLLDALVGIGEGPWALMFEDALKHDKHQTAAAKLARLLRNYKNPDGKRLKPHTIRVDDEFPKGFYRADFEREWERYLTTPLPTPPQAATSATSATKPQVTSENDVAFSTAQSCNVAAADNSVETEVPF